MYQQALALAFYRAGKPDRAIETIRAIEPVNERPNSNPLPHILAVEAMASHQLGDKAHAQAALVELRKLVQADHWANNQEVQGLYHEAETVVVAPP